jgi:O-methyltransferase involved in polyketide biosynthesis
VNGSAGVEPLGFDPTTLNAARIYDYWLGGKDNFAADRVAAERIIAYAPEIPRLAVENRRFLSRVVRYLAAAGIRQFIDIGTGLPSQGHVHEVLQVAAPDARVAYVDHDPVVLVHARAMLRGSDHVSVVRGDLRDPAGILGNPQLLELIDMEQPVAVLLLALLHLMGDDEQAMHAVARLRDAMAPGSYLAISHAVCDQDENNESIAKILKLYREGPMKDSKRQIMRSEKEVLAFFADMEFVEPGVVPLSAWRPERDERRQSIASIWSIGGIARKR